METSLYTTLPACCTKQLCVQWLVSCDAYTALLYTSDAAGEEDSVEGGSDQVR